ncbi:hypothetical protein D9757_002832 [Collybiopsis confluens]|uniref:Uncharacterized protein n=1 Tax=Collybiopsis confluens TaxID=2823264 RepID=A0A8H5HVQ4_9AGAR|nr:hypothetical protein D9757_002832 [Collybiopsis confluens]
MSVTLLRVFKRQLCPRLRCTLSSTRHIRSASIPTAAHSTPKSISSNVTLNASSSDTSSDTIPGVKKSEKGKAKSKKAPSRNMLEDSKILNYLAEIAESRHSLTLEDIGRLRPERHSSPETSQYEEEYNALVDKLCRSFSRKQLTNLVEMLEIEGPGGHAAKQLFAIQIIEGSWGWPSLTDVQAKKRDWSETRSELIFFSHPYGSTPIISHSWKRLVISCRISDQLLIRKIDGSNLHALSRKYNIHIGFSTNPLSLNVEGLRGALKQIREHITSFKEDIEEEFYALTSDQPIPTELLQRISRLSGVFTERFGEGKIRLSYLRSDVQAAFIAKRLITHVVCEMETKSRGTILAHIPPNAPLSSSVPLSLFPHHYALYPFVSSRSLPWNINASGAFRARKVAEWIGSNSTEDVQKSGGLELGRGRTLDMEENPADIRQQLFQALPEPSEGRSRDILATVGHILLIPPPSDLSSLRPPIDGTWSIFKLLKWIREEHIDRLFMPSIPSPILQSSPLRPRLLHRLIYEASPADNSKGATRVLELEIVLPSETVNEGGASEPAPEDSTKSSHLDSTLYHVCRVGDRSVVDLMLPDRAMDIRFSVFDSQLAFLSARRH